MKFEPGQSGNPNGARRTRKWLAMLEKAIKADEAKSPDEASQKLRKAAEALLESAANGDLPALKELGDRLDGKSTQQIDATGDLSLTVQLLSADADA